MLQVIFEDPQRKGVVHSYKLLDDTVHGCELCAAVDATPPPSRPGKVDWLYSNVASSIAMSTAAEKNEARARQATLYPLR